MPSNLFSRQPSFGWGTFQTGFGRKADPEPGRCRRTDGKKWRCTKEACPDSKYCEKHMQRGRNRSRKPMEFVTTANNSSSTNQILNSSLSSALSAYSLSTLSSLTSTSEANISHQQLHHNLSFHPSYHPSYSRPPPTPCLMPQSNIDSYSSSQTDLDSRYVHETKDGVNERNFFPEDSWTLRSLPDQYPPLAPSRSNGYPQLHYQSLTDHSSQHPKQQQHCFVLGTDFKSPSVKVEREEETEKPFHHFFPSWLDIGENQTSRASFPAAQLSVSMPLFTQDLFSPKSTFGADG